MAKPHRLLLSSHSRFLQRCSSPADTAKHLPEGHGVLLASFHGIVAERRCNPSAGFLEKSGGPKMIDD